MQTGYPVYPFEYISVPVKWKMEKDEVRNLSKNISDNAKGIFGVEGSENIEQAKKEWMKSRFMTQHRRVETFYPLVLAIIGLVFIIITKRCLIWKKLGIFMLPALGQVGMWYFHSPDTRFASFAFWWLGAGLGCFAIKDLFQRRLLGSLPIVVLLFSFSLHTIDAFGEDKDLFVLEPSEFVPIVPKKFIYTTKSGLELLVPENGKRCDNCPLPCTQNPRPNIRLIEPGIIESGFYLE